MPEQINDVRGLEVAKVVAAELGRLNETYQDLERKKSSEVKYDEVKADTPKIVSHYGETFNFYQEFVKSMKVYPEKHAIVYPALGIAGEGGEVAEKVKKWLRGDRELDKLELLKEAGDVLWYITSLADDLGYTLQDLVNENVKKLSSRKERGVQKGDGDNR